MNAEISSAEQVVTISSVAIDVTCCPAGNLFANTELLRMAYCRAGDVTGRSLQCNCGQVLLSSGHALIFIFGLYYDVLSQIMLH